MRTTLPTLRSRTLFLAALIAILATMLVLSQPTSAQGGEPPAKPTGLSNTATHDSVTLTWGDPEDDSITGYQVLRRERTASTVLAVIVNDTGSDATSYTDNTVEPEKAYEYRVKAINANGLSGQSNAANADTAEDTTTTETYTVTVPRAAAAPVITSDASLTVVEGSTLVATLTATDDDVASDQLIWSIPLGAAGGADANQFLLSTDGVLSFTSAKDYDQPDDSDGDRRYEVTVQVSDGANPDTADLVVTLANVFELTTVTGPTEVPFTENGGGRVATFTASSDEDRDGIEWSVAGADGNHFSIDSPPGVLRFHIDPVSPNIFPKLPDYEEPDDANSDNVYSITLTAQAGGQSNSPFTVTVTVIDVDEPGAISLSTTRPKAGSMLTATLTDPDGVTDGTVTWRWERSTGPNSWAVIDGATSSAYTPGAADTGAFLRVTATYADEHGTASALNVPPSVVLGPLLASFAVTSNNASAAGARTMYPAFNPEILHYAIGCNAADTMTLSLSAPDNARLAVNGTQVPGPSGTVMIPVTEDSNVPVLLANMNGARTTYEIHCLSDSFPLIEATSTDGAWDGLITVSARAAGSMVRGSFLALIDRNGVPRFRRWLADVSATNFRFHPDGRYPYSYGRNVGTIPTFREENTLSNNAIVILDDFLRVVEEVQVEYPLTQTGNHDFVIRENGNYVFMGYEPARRDLSAFTNSDGVAYSTTEGTEDSVVQEVRAGSVVFDWNSWGNVAIEDCTQHRFPWDYAHLNSLQLVGDDVIVSLRGCSQVLRIDGATGNIKWLLGRSNRSDAEWEAKGVPVPLNIVGDPYGEFCGQHSARLLPNGALILFDNGGFCVEDPETGQSSRSGGVFSRAVEFAVDPTNGEAVFMRHHSLHKGFDRYARSQGHIQALDDGSWLISWGRGIFDDDPSTPLPPDQSITQVDPTTGTELLSVRLKHKDSDAILPVRAYPVPAEALAAESRPLAAMFPESSYTSLFNPGTSGTAQIVVAFNQPVVDFAASTSSIDVEGATVQSASAHVVAGEAANAYIITLAPTGDGEIVVEMSMGERCDEGGVCTAAGQALAETPPRFVLVPPYNFDESKNAQRAVPENTLAGTDFGDPVAVIDPDTHVTYSLGGPDANSFTIAATTGQLQTSAPLDYETRQSYTVDVTATAPSGVSDTITVTIQVEDVNEPPVTRGGGGGGFGPALVAPGFMDGFRTTRTVPQNARAGDVVGEPVSATHPDELEIAYSLSGTDASLFTVDEETGQIRVKEGVDLTIGRAYTVNLTATDSAGFGAIIIVVIEVTEASISPYDHNGNNKIERDEVIMAVADYFKG